MRRQLASIALALPLLLALSACETTGDPRAGGLFGWSEGKAQQRIADRQGILSDINQDNAQLRASARAKERTISKLQSGN